MLAENLKQEIRDAYQRLIDRRGLRPRWGQRQMIAAVANALGDPDQPHAIAAVEAGTGTGKTIAYTVAALPIARDRAKTLVIATATVALQEQLIQRDLPDILTHSGLDFSVSLAKGRGRYACLQKIDHQLAGSSAPALIPLYPDELPELAVEEALPVMESMISAMASNTWDGDLDAWPGSIDDSLRRMITTDAVQCSGRRCGYIQQCPFFRAREGLDEADVIVANHNLVLADLKFGGGAILPPPEDCIFIFDEGHQLAEKCLNQFTLAVRTSTTRQALRETQQWLRAQQQSLGEFIGQTDLLEELQGSLDDVLQLNSEVADWGEAFLLQQAEQSDEWRFPHGVVPEELRQRSAHLCEQWRRQRDLAQRLLQALESRREEAEVSQRDSVDAWTGTASAMLARCESQVELWLSYRQAETPDAEQPWARWIRGTAREGDGVILLASPVLADELLNRHLWSRAAGVIMTSATLSSLGNFSRLIAMTGLPAEANFQRVDSPFDTSKAIFSIPLLQSDPSDSDAHTAEIVARVPELISRDRGVLMLFSSRRQMEAVVLGLEGEVPHELLVQDSRSKASLLSKHRENIDAGRPSILMGLASFAEGIDLPGEYCDHVVIAKLPFSVPDSPREAAHAELLEQLGKNPFMEISVPDAALRLTQASGRLLRTEDDAGRITLLDRRLITRRYGQAILESLPAFTLDLAK